jgi:hypothetical protein
LEGSGFEFWVGTVLQHADRSALPRPASRWHFDAGASMQPQSKNLFSSGREETDECFRSPARESQGGRNFVTVDGPAADAAGYNDALHGSLIVPLD